MIELNDHLLKVYWWLLVFSRKWVNMIVKFTSTVSFLLLLNGRRCEVLIPKRGIRQRDTLSPYLFILCAEGLSCLVDDLVMQDRIRGFKVSHGA